MIDLDNLDPNTDAKSRANIGKKLILSMDSTEFVRSNIEKLFASHHDKKTHVRKPPAFVASSKISLNKNEYQWVKEPVETTLGLLVANRYLLERIGIIEFCGYWNKPLTEGAIGDMCEMVNALALANKISIEQLGEFIDARDRLGFWCNTFMSSSITSVLIDKMPDVEKRKAELFKEKAAELNSDNPVTQVMAANAIEKELIGMVKENVKSDIGYDMYASGVNNFDNNYKTINIMRGAEFNEVEHKYDVVQNSLMGGISKNDIKPFSNSVEAAAYPSAIGTADAGYESKIMLALLQSEEIDPDINSDCGTESTIPVTMTNKNKRYFMFRYFKVNGQKVFSTPENISKFVDREVQMYSPQCCLNKKICCKCAGKVMHNMGIQRIGLTMSQITQKLLNIKLKSKHDLSQGAGGIEEKYIFDRPNEHCYVKEGKLYNKKAMKLFIPKFMEDIDGFVRESTLCQAFGVFKIAHYDDKGTEIFSTLMTVPAVLPFNLYNDIEEDRDFYIISYDPESEIASLCIRQSAANCEFYLNQIYFNSTSPQLPYNKMTDLMFKCMTINNVDLTGISLVYETLARRVCRAGNDSFAKVYGKDMNVDQLSYDKKSFRQLVHQAGVLQGILFQDMGKAISTGLHQTLTGVKSQDTPLEKIVKA